MQVESIVLTWKELSAMLQFLSEHFSFQKGQIKVKSPAKPINR